jgi:dihydrofolate synthase/folylpolyglutamate synthase
MANYQSAVAQMFALGHELAQTPSHKFDLAHMRALLAALGHPETRCPAVLVAGTNGKGSTSATLASILEVSGLKTGLYTSPHLLRINERIRVDGNPIPDDDFAALHEVVERTAERLLSEGALPWHPSFFEMLTAIAFEYFARTLPDIVVLEVGMGGRLDATNVVEPRLSIITDIALDHQQYLGETIAEIAREKAGIIRPNGVVVTLPQLPEANDVIGNAILDANARVVNAVPYVAPLSPGSPRSLSGSPESGPRNRYPLELMQRHIIVDSPLAGRHQLRNLALAVAAAEELHHQGFPGITAATIERGIRHAHWPGRFQFIPAHGRYPDIVLDVAHNPAGAWALRSTLSAYLESGILKPNMKPKIKPGQAADPPAAADDGGLTLVFGVMRDKAVQEMTEILFPLARHVVLTHANNPRSATPDEIRQAAARVTSGIEIETAENVAQALDRARKLAPPDGLVVVTGSIYIVGEAMQMLGLSI